MHDCAKVEDVGVVWYPSNQVKLPVPFGKELLIRLATFSLYIISILFVVSHFGFGGGTLILIAQVPGHCLPFTSQPAQMNSLT